MAWTSAHSEDTCPIENLPVELLENILVEVAKDVVPPSFYCEEDEKEKFRCYRDGEPGCSLEFRLTSRLFRDCSWRAFGAFLGETVFDLRSRQSISNLTAVSDCKDLASWFTKLTIACRGTPIGYPLLRRPSQKIRDRLDIYHQDFFPDLSQIKKADESWYPGIWNQWKKDLSPMTRRKCDMAASQEAGAMTLQEVLAKALHRFGNLDYVRFYHEPSTFPGRYHNFLQKFGQITHHTYATDGFECEYMAQIGLEILIHALVASQTTVRTMMLAVDLDDHHAFPANVPQDIFGMASQKVETLVLTDMYCPLYDEKEHDSNARLSVTKTLFPKLRSLTIDHKGFPDHEDYHLLAPLPLPSDTPALEKLTVRNTTMTEKTLLSFLACYGQHTRHIAIESPAGYKYLPVLQLMRNLSVETLEIERCPPDSYWDLEDQVYNAGQVNDKAKLLAEFPLHLVRQAAKTVKFHPPLFQQDLERYWLEHSKKTFR